MSHYLHLLCVAHVGSNPTVSFRPLLISSRIESNFLVFNLWIVQVKISSSFSCHNLTDHLLRVLLCSLSQMLSPVSSAFSYILRLCFQISYDIQRTAAFLSQPTHIEARKQRIRQQKRRQRFETPKKEDHERTHGLAGPARRRQGKTDSSDFR